MKMAIVLCALAMSGCARFSTTQTDTRNETETTITTKASAWTFFDSKSALATWKATQSEKSQGASVGGLSQESSGTNAVNLIEAVARGAIKGASEAMVPK